MQRPRQQLTAAGCLLQPADQRQPGTPHLHACFLAALRSSVDGCLRDAVAAHNQRIQLLLWVLQLLNGHLHPTQVAKLHCIVQRIEAAAGAAGCARLASTGGRTQLLPPAARRPSQTWRAGRCADDCRRIGFSASSSQVQEPGRCAQRAPRCKIPCEATAHLSGAPRHWRPRIWRLRPAPPSEAARGRQVRPTQRLQWLQAFLEDLEPSDRSIWSCSGRRTV